MNNLKNRIAEARKEKGLTLKELGKLVNLGDNTISQYETGKREPKLVTWQKLANELGVSVPYLQGVSDDPRTSSEILDEYKRIWEEAGGDSPETAPTSEAAKMALLNIQDFLFSAEANSQRMVLSSASEFLSDAAMDLDYFLNAESTPEERRSKYQSMKTAFSTFLDVFESEISAANVAPGGDDQPK